MNVSTVATDNAWQGLQTSERIPMGAALLPESADDRAIARFDQSVDVLQFSGQLVIPTLPIQAPPQNFTAVFTEFGATFENDPKDSWPKIIIKFVTKLPLGRAKAKNFFSLLRSHKIEDFRVRPADDTVDAKILYTRLMLCLYKANACKFEASGFGNLFGFRFDAPLESEMWQLLYRAKLYRKLKYIEYVFRQKLVLPTYISADEVRRIEVIFRGITEGEFTMRSSSITFTNVLPSEIDVSKPPFDGVGSFIRNVGDKELLFGKGIDIGFMTVRIERADLASPQVIDHIRKGLSGPVDVRFEVWDNQIHHRFESYARQPRKRLQQRLERFKRQLALEEPLELANLLSEPLQNDVSSDEAIQIAVGWQYYNRLPDRYCPQEPEIDLTTGHWRVPIYIVYPSGEGGPVGELLIDKKTGVIISHTPIEELRSRGMALAQQILHVC